jgi:hypothetical protein
VAQELAAGLTFAAARDTARAQRRERDLTFFITGFASTAPPTPTVHPGADGRSAPVQPEPGFNWSGPAAGDREPAGGAPARSTARGDGRFQSAASRIDQRWIAQPVERTRARREDEL